MLWMTVFHLFFDLNHFGYVKNDFYTSPFWTVQRTLILSLFLFCAGMAQATVVGCEQSWQRFWQRWMQVSVCALAVTLASWWMYPKSFIYFGVLHAMACFLIVGRLTVHKGQALWWWGAAAIVLHTLVTWALNTPWGAPWAQVLNRAPWNVLGLITQKPITEDYVPLLPWLAVFWWGSAAGSWLHGAAKQPTHHAWGERLLHASERFSRSKLLTPLAALGRWSLSYYMLHQPVMIGVLMLVSWRLQP